MVRKHNRNQPEMLEMMALANKNIKSYKIILNCLQENTNTMRREVENTIKKIKGRKNGTTLIV